MDAEEDDEDEAGAENKLLVFRIAQWLGQVESKWTHSLLFFLYKTYPVEKNNVCNGIALIRLGISNVITFA